MGHSHHYIVSIAVGNLDLLNSISMFVEPTCIVKVTSFFYVVKQHIISAVWVEYVVKVI